MSLIPIIFQSQLTLFPNFFVERSLGRLLGARALSIDFARLKSLFFFFFRRKHSKSECTIHPTEWNKNMGAHYNLNLFLISKIYKSYNSKFIENNFYSIIFFPFSHFIKAIRVRGRFHLTSSSNCIILSRKNQAIGHIKLNLFILINVLPKCPSSYWWSQPIYRVLTPSHPALFEFVSASSSLDQIYHDFFQKHKIMWLDEDNTIARLRCVDERV